MRRFRTRWRNNVKRFDSRLSQGNGEGGDEISCQFASFWQSQREEIDTIVSRAEALAKRLDDQPSAFVVCHADIHAGNIMVGPSSELSIVDWDTVILAPKERDLMFVGGGVGVGGVWNQTQEETLFYQGYGPTNIDPVAQAYYRYERIVVDLAEFCEQLFDMDASANDRNEGLKQMASQFRPNNVVDIAHRTWRRIV